MATEVFMAWYPNGVAGVGEALLLIDHRSMSGLRLVIQSRTHPA